MCFLRCTFSHPSKTARFCRAPIPQFMHLTGVRFPPGSTPPTRQPANLRASAREPAKPANLLPRSLAPAFSLPRSLAPCLSADSILAMYFSPRSARCAALALLLCATALLPPCAQNSASATLAPAPSMQRPVRTISQISVSPDGKRLAWIESAEIHVAPLGTLDKSQRVTAAPSPGDSCTESAPVWSPDSAAVAFFSDCADLGGQADLYLSRLDGKPPQRLSQLHGYVNAPAFSPDGKRIAFLYVEGATRPTGALAAMDAPSGVIGEDRIEIQRVAAVSVSAAQPSAPTFFTPASLYVYEFDWSPDSQSLAYVAADPPGENNWWIAKLYTQSVSAPSTSSEVAPSHESAGTPSHESSGAPSYRVRRDQRRTRRVGDPASGHSLPFRSLRPSPRPPNRPSPLVARRQSHRLHRRPHERSGRHRRRRLDDSGGGRGAPRPVAG